MTVKLYRNLNGSSQRKTEAELREKNIKYIDRHMIKEPITKDELHEMLKHTENGVEDILSTRSLDYARLIEEGIDFNDMTLSELHYAFQKHPQLIRTPIIVTDNLTIVGYKEGILATLEGREIRMEKHLKILNKLRERENMEIEMMRFENAKYGKSKYEMTDYETSV